MDFFFATMPRSGSEFVIRLTKVFNDQLFNKPIIGVQPGRMVVDSDGNKSKELIHMQNNGEGVRFFQACETKWAKIESPGIDILCFSLHSHFPHAKWIGSIRSIERIITSHFNIKTWGWSEQKILSAYIHDLTFYEYVVQTGKLFLIDIEKPEKFQPELFKNFLGLETIPDRVEKFVRNWNVVNPLEKQKKKANEIYSGTEVPPNLKTLRIRHPWLTDIEERYNVILRKTNQ